MTDAAAGAAEMPAVEGDETSTLIRAALAGKKQAIDRLVSRLTPVIQARVSRWLARHGGRALGSMSHDDLIQEIWLVLLRNEGRVLGSYDPSRGATLEGYVGIVSERELWNLKTKELETVKRRIHVVTRASEHIERAAAPDSPEAEVAAKQLSDKLARYLWDALPAKGRTICRYLYADHVAPDVVAEALNVNRQVIYNWQNRIRQLTEEFMREERPAP